MREVVEMLKLPEQRPATIDGIEKSRISLMYDRVGAALYGRGAYDESHGVYKLAIDAHSDDARTQNNLGVVKLELGRAEEAKACFGEALRIGAVCPLAVYSVELVLDMSLRPWLVEVRLCVCRYAVAIRMRWKRIFM